MTEPTTARRGPARSAGWQARPILTTQARLALRVLSEADVAPCTRPRSSCWAPRAPRLRPRHSRRRRRFVLAGRVPEHDVALGAGLVWLAAGAATAGEAGVPERVRRLAGGDSVPATDRRPR